MTAQSSTGWMMPVIAALSALVFGLSAWAWSAMNDRVESQWHELRSIHDKLASRGERITRLERDHAAILDRVRWLEHALGVPSRPPPPVDPRDRLP